MSESIRLTFSYGGEEVSLKSANRLMMKAPAGMRNSRESLAENVVGRWVEIRDQQGQPIYRRLVHRFIPFDVEIPTVNPQASLRRVQRQIGEDIFHILIPVIKEAKEVVLLEQQVRRNEPLRRCEYAKIDLEQINNPNLNNSEVQ